MDDAGFREYISAHLDHLRRMAYLMCGDWHLADDVVATAVLKLYQRWHRIGQIEHRDSYIRRVVVNVWLDELRRPWRRERPVRDFPAETAVVDDPSVPDRLSVLKLLGVLPADRRAVVVLRFYCDLSVMETAQVLQCSPGTVKSRTARALETLRASVVDASDLI